MADGDPVTATSTTAAVPSDDRTQLLIWKALAGLGVAMMPVVIILANAVWGMRTEINDLKKDIANVPQVVQSTLSTNELSKAREELREVKALLRRQEGGGITP